MSQACLYQSSFGVGPHAGSWIIPNYDPSVIETYPLGNRLVIAQFQYPGGNMGPEIMSKDPHVVHTREVDRGQAGGAGEKCSM